jgi:O-antigen/teichoic acid export membrane protein
MDLAGKGKPWIALKAMIPALIINIILNIILIPEKGANGAAIASTISYSIAAILFTFFYSKTSKVSIKQIFTYKKNYFKLFMSVFNKLMNK